MRSAMATEADWSEAEVRTETKRKVRKARKPLTDDHKNRFLQKHFGPKGEIATSERKAPVQRPEWMADPSLLPKRPPGR